MPINFNAVIAIIIGLLTIASLRTGGSFIPGLILTALNVLFALIVYYV